ncbi:NACHT domain-containing protein [bacterium]|nr:NACHT domain-containing protein [bacterium]
MDASDLKLELRQPVDELFLTAVQSSREDESLPKSVRQNRRQRAKDRVVEALASRGSAEMSDRTLADVRRLLSRWAQRGFADGYAEVEQFEIRCARDFDLFAARQSGDEQRILNVLEDRYRDFIRERFGRHEIRGIQTAERVMLDLDQVYVPQFLQVAFPSGPIDEELLKNMPLLPGQRVEASIALQNQRHLLIVGVPGSGKTTLIAWLATQLAQRELGPKIGLPENCLPFVVTVREWSGEVNLVSDIEFLRRYAGCERETLDDALATGRAVILVDGLDESPTHQAALLANIIASVAKEFPNAPIVVTSRPSGFVRGENNRLEGFTETNLESMSDSDVSSYVHKWCLAAETSLRKEQRQAEKDAEFAANDLIGRLEKSRAVKRLATTPLLCTILCVVHRFLGHRIPEHRVTLYEKCTDALLYEWDASKFREGAMIGRLDAAEKRILLGALARHMHENHLSEIAEPEVVRIFDEQLASFACTATAAEIIEEIRDRSGILIERADHQFAFSHLTFQEYLTALDWARKDDVTRLAEHAEDDWWHEVILLAAGIESVDAETLIRSLLLCEDKSAVFLAAQCLETAREVPSATRRLVEASLEPLVPPKNAEEAQELAEIGLVAAPVLTTALSEAQTTRDRVLLIHAVREFEYSPAISVLARLCGDHRELEEPQIFSTGTSVIVTEIGSVDEKALITLADLSRSHPLSIFAAAAAKASRKARSRVLDYLRVLAMSTERETEFPEKVPGKPSSYYLTADFLTWVSAGLLLPHLNSTQPAMVTRVADMIGVLESLEPEP